MNKNKSLALSLLLPLLVAAPLTAQAAAALEPPGIQTTIRNDETAANITKEDDIPKETANQTRKFSIGKILIASEDIPLKDYSEFLAPYENREVSLAELETLTLTLTQELRSSGYPAATIYLPAQRFQQGDDLFLEVAPGRYGKITIDNQSKFPTALAEGYFANLTADKVIKNIELETAVQKLSQIAGINVVCNIAPGKESGTADINVRINGGRLTKELLYAENYGSSSAGRYRYGLQGGVHIPQAAGSLNYAIVFSNGGQHNYNLGYTQTVGRSATKLRFTLSRGDYELAGFSDIGAKGLAYTAALSGSTPLYTSYRDSLDVIYGYNFRKLEDKFETYDINKKKHSHSIYAGLSGMSRRGKAAFGYDIMHLTGKLAFDNEDAAYLYGESKTEGMYNKTTIDLSYLQTFDSHFDMLLKFSGQLAYNNLDSSEEIVLGGINGVRAYPTGSGSGDEGYIANLELRYHTKIPGLTFSTYLDMGHVKITHDKSNPAYGGETAKGWGIGITYTKPDDFFLRLDYARRIGGFSYYTDKDAQSKGRIWFMLGKMF